MAAAQEYLESRYRQDNQLNRLNYGIISCGSIHNREMYYSFDNTSRRLHTNLTNLPKELKPFISYAGSKLVSVDVKNAQPFFITAVLRQAFYQEGELSINKLIATTFKEQATRQRALSTAQPTIMLLKSLKQSDIENINRFLQIVSSGQLYEIYQAEYESLTGHKISRSKAKEKFIKQLYSEPKHYRDERYVFSCMFPAVLQMPAQLTPFSRLKLSRLRVVKLAVLCTLLFKGQEYQKSTCTHKKDTYKSGNKATKLTSLFNVKLFSNSEVVFIE